MAYDYISPKEITQVKNELLKFRDEYGPAVRMLDFIRQTDVSRIELSPGEYITLYELESGVAQSSTLEAHLKSMLESSRTLRLETQYATTFPNF